jgi:glycosyltransferase involved in cell wall biosynthesis
MTIEEQNPFFYAPWVSAAVLEPPVFHQGKWEKGALIINQVDPVLELFPELKQCFFVIERRGWYGPNDARQADIKLVEDLTTWEESQRAAPAAILLDIGPADFVDHAAFFPLDCPTEYDVIQISCWSARKRIELFIDAAERLPHLRFVHLGHFEFDGKAEEYAYMDSCVERAERIAKNVSFPLWGTKRNEELPTAKTQVNQWINLARVGVLTTMSEGINRFKMECLAAGRPMLVPSDVDAPTRKHITAETGALFEPTADALAGAIVSVLERRDALDPRGYVLANTGKTRSLNKLKAALREVCARTGGWYHFDGIDWDGRNQSLAWGENGLRLLGDLVEQFRSRPRAGAGHAAGRRMD